MKKTNTRRNHKKPYKNKTIRNKDIFSIMYSKLRQDKKKMIKFQKKNTMHGGNGAITTKIKDYFKTKDPLIVHDVFDLKN